MFFSQELDGLHHELILKTGGTEVNRLLKDSSFCLQIDGFLIAGHITILNYTHNIRHIKSITYQ